MDFLRRLHPRRAGSPGAVRPDLGAWRAAGLPRQGVAREHTGATAVHMARSSDDRSDGLAPPPGVAAALPVHVAEPVAKVLRRADTAAAAAAADGPPQPPDHEASAAAPRVRPTPDAPPLALRPAPPGPPAPAAVAVPPARPAAVARPAAPPRDAATPARAIVSPPTRPLRAEVQPLHRAAAEPAAPTVVQVTIDRIDLRLPPERAAAAAAPRRARAAPTVALADYLRERDGGRR